jgi:hypothetical protein
MNQLSTKVIFFLCSIVFFYGCTVKKKDFDPDNVEWKDITPAWGVPLIYSKMTIADAAAKNESNLIISYDPNDDDFITFIYLDTVYSPQGEKLFNAFGNTFNLGVYNTLGAPAAAAISVAPVGKQVTVVLPGGTIPFSIDSVKSLSELKLKDGILTISGSSRIRHNVSMTLTFPDMVSASGTALVQTLTLNHKANTQLTQVTLPDINLDGYTIKTSAPNQLRYSLSVSVQVLNNDNNNTVNLTTADDSLNFTLGFESLGYKYIIGEFYPLVISAIPSGSTDINVFDNVLIGQVRFTRPQISFKFLNSFGVVPTVEIDNAEMRFRYDTNKVEKLLTPVPYVNPPNLDSLNIPGLTKLKAPSQMGDVAQTKFVLDTLNSTIRSVLTGAPYKFNYSIPFVSLSSPSGQAFIADDSQLEIQTEVRIPMEGRVDYIVISDTVKDLELPSASHVEYVEFRVGSTNSIPFSIDMQGYFLDSNGVLIDSLVVPPDSKQIVGPGLPIDFADFNHEVIKQTTPASYQSVIHIPQERYKKICLAKYFVIAGRMHTLGSDLAPPKSVKFYPWQECIFQMAVYAKLIVDPTDPTSIVNIQD